MYPVIANCMVIYVDICLLVSLIFNAVMATYSIWNEVLRFGFIFDTQACLCPACNEHSIHSFND